MEWIIPSNLKYYDVIGAFEEFNKLDWKQSVSIEQGDIVYIYVGNPISAIKFKCVATKVNLGEIEIDDSKYTRKNKVYTDYKNYMELELIESYNDTLFTYTKLKNNGLKSVQGPSRVKQNLSNYISINDSSNKQETQSIGFSKKRLGQAELRNTILLNYNNKCAICDIHHSDLLNCSHIIPWSMDEENRLNPENAICLCALHDRLFDKGYFSLDNDYNIIFGPKADNTIKELFNNAKFHLPNKDKPNKKFLRFHYNEVCKK